ncbi:MAG: glutamyl-tRNA reductase [Nocardioides sp.]
MSVLVVGVSHKSAPVSMLEQLALDHDATHKLLLTVADTEHVTESAVIATCNRVEVYAEVDRFHGSVEEVSRLLAERAGLPVAEVTDHLYVHYDQGAVSHLFQVAAGLDSMAVGEAQVLGQTREALRLGQELGTVGPALNLLFQQALRVGKRAHAETDIDIAAPSLVTAALSRAATPVTGKRVVILGAGSIASVATATIARLGPAHLTVVNRSDDHALELAAKYAGEPFGVESAPLSELSQQLATTDLLVTCTGAADVLITTDLVAMARGSLPAGPAAPPLTIIDLALPHDVDPAVVALPGLHLVNLADLAEASAGSLNDDVRTAISSVRAIVREEVATFVAARRRAGVTPTVVALRSMATTVVDAEIARLDARLPGLEPAVRDEVRATMRRVADKLLHQPTVRVRELADSGDAVSYAAALVELFSLDPDAVAAVTRGEGFE